MDLEMFGRIWKCLVGFGNVLRDLEKFWGIWRILVDLEKF